MESMSNDAGNDDDLFDLGPDESSDDIARPAGVTGTGGRDDEDGMIMDTNPYDPDDCQGEDGDADARGAKANDYLDGSLHGSLNGSLTGDASEGDTDDDEVHSLMDHAFDEVDDLLLKKGRISVIGDSIAPADSILNPRSEPDSGGEYATTTRSGGHQSAMLLDPSKRPQIPQLPHKSSARPAPNGQTSAKDKNRGGKDFVVKRNSSSNSSGGGGGGSKTAHGTGMQAAKTITSRFSSAPGENARDIINPTHAATTSLNHLPAASSPGTLRHRGAQSYDSTNRSATTANNHDMPAGSAVSSSPTRSRRGPKEPPYIEAKGLTLTYTQAKLFGLAGPACPGSPPKPLPCDASHVQPVPLDKVLTATKASSWYFNATASEGPTIAHFPAAGRRDVFRGCARDKWKRGRPHSKYSKSRMEDLARPVAGFPSEREAERSAGRGGRETNIARGNEPSFTWKRSRKAEAAMRNPACGYDFVEDAGALSNAKGFLGRVEAYSNYSKSKMETRRAEEEYEAQLDKLQCPQCGSAQSYDEYASKKLKCPGCDVPYRMMRTWNRRVWEHRVEMCAMKSDERQAGFEREAEEEFRRRRPRQTKHAALMRQRVGKVGFIARMRKDLRRRRTRQDSGGNIFQSGRYQSSNINADKIAQDYGLHRRPASAGTTRVINPPVLPESALKARPKSAVCSRQR